MHELSIAQALLDLVEEHTPAGGILRRVDVRAGPMQAIEPEALRLAWEVTTRGTAREGARLRLQTLPWRLHCIECGRDYESAQVDEVCDCGSASALPSGSDELTLMSLEIDVED